MGDIVAGIAGLTIGLVACGQPATEKQPSADDVTADRVTRRVPQHNNEHVEAWKTIIVPNQPLSMHRHDNPRTVPEVSTEQWGRGRG